MRDSCGKIPKIIFLRIGDKTLAVCVNRRNPRISVQHDGPLACRVPVQLPDASGGKSHVYACHRLRDGQFPNSHLPRPPAFVNTLVREGERILEVSDQALGVRCWWPHGIRVLTIELVIRRARVTFASVCTDDFLQCGKAAYCRRCCSDEISTSKFAHNDIFLRIRGVSWR